MKLIFFTLFASFAFATGNQVQLGVYSGAIEVHDTVAFELLSGGKAVVTSDYFNIDGTKKEAPAKVMHGSWSYQDPFLTISFAGYKDKLRKEDCPQTFPCFKFEESFGKKSLSPLNVPYGFGIRIKK
jgi:hypothetical protein